VNRLVARLLVVGLLLATVGCAEPDTKKLCTPIVLDSIVAQAYRESILAEADARSRIILAERTADGLNALAHALSFATIMATLWLSRQFWYLERRSQK
jgi:hypothetical protein